MNIARLISESAARRPEKPALVFEGKSYSYGEVDRRIALYAQALESLGVRKGDRVAVQTGKRPDFLFLHFGVLALGAVTLPLNSDYKGSEVAYFLEDSQASLFVTTCDLYKRAASELERLSGLKIAVLDEGDVNAVDFSAALATCSGDFAPKWPTAECDAAMFCYTSGTTGRSKGAMITHGNLAANTLALQEAWKWSENDILLHVLPLFHVHGLNVAATGSLIVGATIIMNDRFEPARCWRSLEKEGCTLLMAVPTIYQRLVNEWENLDPRPDLSGMRVFISGSAPLSDNLFNRFEKCTGFRILERYGMTETGMITSNSIEMEGRKAKSVGFPLPGVSVQIASPDGSPALPGNVGEVWIKGPNVFSGYWNMPDKTAESFTDGWFKSGDMGYMDPADKGRLYLVGRGKELIITGGYNVYPKEIENILESHSAVREVAVVGVADDDFGELVTAAVVLAEGSESTTAEELLALCKKNLAGYKCPKEIRFVEGLPRNAMGKIQKNILADLFSSKV